jgi:hypothetical protein
VGQPRADQRDRDLSPLATALLIATLLFVSTPQAGFTQRSMVDTVDAEPPAEPLTVAEQARFDARLAKTLRDRAPADRALLQNFVAVIGSPEGQFRFYDEMKQAFPGIRPALDAALPLLVACQPIRSSGYNVVWAYDRDAKLNDPLHCSTGQDSSRIDQVRALLRHAGVLSVGYSIETGVDDKSIVSAAQFMTWRFGLSVAGSATSLIYLRAPHSCLRVKRGGAQDGYTENRRAVTGAPCHWFWDQTNE